MSEKKIKRKWIHCLVQIKGKMYECYRLVEREKEKYAFEEGHWLQAYVKLRNTNVPIQIIIKGSGIIKVHEGGI